MIKLIIIFQYTKGNMLIIQKILFFYHIYILIMPKIYIYVYPFVTIQGII